MATEQADKAQPRRRVPKRNAVKPDTPDPVEMAMRIEQGDLARQVLLKQSKLIEAQVREIHFNHFWHVVLRSILAALGGFLLLGLAAMLWDAASDDSLVIDSFSVPPDLAARGLTGEVIAAKLQDELNRLDRETVTIRASRTYANDWEGNIRVEIPETAISLGELRRVLHGWLGRATHVSGSAFHEAGKVMMDARVSGKSYAASGENDAINPLVQQLALAVFGDTQPFRYGVKLYREEREDETFAIMGKLAKSQRAEERFWASAFFARNLHDLPRQRDYALQATRELGDSAHGWNLLAENELAMGHLEAAIGPVRKANDLLKSSRDPRLSDNGHSQLQGEAVVLSVILFGDFQKAEQAAATLAENPVRPYNAVIWPPLRMDSQVLLHERLSPQTTQFLAVMAAQEKDHAIMRQQVAMHHLAAQLAGNWTEIAGQADAIIALPPWQGTLMPLLAEAYAHLGRNAEADAIIAALPADHYERWRSCGRIATLRKDWAAGERCFREAIRQAPSIPRGYFDYGTMLAARGDLAGAISQFTLAHEKGPRWADPLKGWGDALVRQGKRDEARQKYEDALKRAPKWRELQTALRGLGA